MNVKAFKQGAEFTGWLRAPAAERFLKDLEKQVEELHDNLMGTCSVSSDPKLRDAFAAWLQMAQLRDFMRNARKESSTEEDE